MVYDAFISYRRSDRVTADGVARFLEAFGLKAFVDRSSRAGTDWEPELIAALQSAKVLVVLWSRSAAGSDWVKREWTLAPEACRIVPIQLDGEPLPKELSRWTAIEGLDVGGRLLQRCFELMKQGHLSAAQAQAQLVDELAKDGVVLEPKQREALGLFLGVLVGVFGAGVAVRATTSEGERNASDGAPRAPSGFGRWLPALSLSAVSSVAAFGAGLWFAGPRKPPPPCPDPPQTAATIAASAPCASPNVTTPECPPPKPCPGDAKLGACQKKRDEAEKRAADERKACAATEAALKDCRQAPPVAPTKSPIGLSDTAVRSVRTTPLFVPPPAPSTGPPVLR